MSTDSVFQNIDTARLNWSTQSPEWLQDQIGQALNTIKVNALFLKLENQTVSRVRLNDEDNLPLKHISQIQCAPPKSIGYGRVNVPHQEMLYCAEHSNICELELLHDYLTKGVGTERMATYTEWRVVKPLNMMVLTIPPGHREISNTLTLRNRSLELIRSMDRDAQVGYWNFYGITNRYFMFNGKAHDWVYPICAALANCFGRAFEDVDGFIFTSVQGYTGYNMVFNKHVLENGSLVPNETIQMKRWSIRDAKINNIEDVATGRIIEDNLVWN